MRCEQTGWAIVPVPVEFIERNRDGWLDLAEHEAESVFAEKGLRIVGPPFFLDGSTMVSAPDGTDVVLSDLNCVALRYPIAPV